MSAPEPHIPIPAETAPVPAPVAGAWSAPTRTSRTVVWLGCHLGELAGVCVPLVPAFTVSLWWATVSGLVAVGWAVHELLFILDDRAGELHLTQHERWSISRAREIADAVRPGGER